MLETTIQNVFAAQQLTQQQSYQLFSAVAEGKISDIVLAALLLSLKTRGETPAEISGIAEAFLTKSLPFPTPTTDFADIVGTGGDGANTINISVTSAIVASCCGAKIIKHGNRSVSSKSGASDLLTALAFPINLTAEQSLKLFNQYGFCFIFAPLYHPAFKQAANVRRELKTRTLFNILGPLVNPARPKKILLGVYSSQIVDLVVNSLKEQNYQHALVVYGNGIDEVNLAATTQIAELANGNITNYSLTAADFGLQPQPLAALVGGDPEENKRLISAILQGQGSIAQQQTIAANVALLLKLFGFKDLKQNAQIALDVLANGVAWQKLQAMISFGNELLNGK